MLFCPNCKSEYRDEILTCSDCGAKLVSELPQEKDKEPRYYENWEKLFNVATEAEAGMIVEVLRTYEIPAFPQAYAVSMIPGSDPRGVDIMVPAEFGKQATSVIMEIYARDDQNTIESIETGEVYQDGDIPAQIDDNLSPKTPFKSGDDINNDSIFESTQYDELNQSETQEDDCIKSEPGRGVILKILIMVVILAFIAYLFKNPSILQMYPFFK